MSRQLLLSFGLSFFPFAALAQTHVAAATTTPPAAVKEVPPTKVSMRIMLDLFRKDFNASSLSLKQPQIGSFRLSVQRDLGENSFADVELRPNETEYYYNYTNPPAPVTLNGLLYYFHLGYRTPIDGLTVAYVREKDPTIGGYLGEYSLTANFIPSLISHQNRIEALRVSYEDKSLSNLKVFYWAARDAAIATSLDTSGNNKLTTSRGADRDEFGYYHRLAAGVSVADFNFELGLGKQTHFLSGLGEKTDLKTEGRNDLFYSAKAEYVGIPDLKFLVGSAYDSYATTKKNDDGTFKADASTMTTLVAGTQYNILPHTLTLYAEYAAHIIKTAEKTLSDYSKDYNATTKSFEKTDSMLEQSIVLGSQIFLDSKLSLVPQYALYLNNRDASYRITNPDGSTKVNYGTSASAVGDRAALIKGSDSKPTSSESQLALRVNYSY